MEYKKLSVEEAVSESVKSFFKINNITYVEVIKDLGISGPALSYHLSGKKFMNSDIASRLSSKFGFNMEYLRTGRGTLFGTGEDRNCDEKIIPSPVLPQYDNIDWDNFSQDQLAAIQNIYANAEGIAKTLESVNEYMKDIQFLRDSLVNQMDILCDSIEHSISNK